MLFQKIGSARICTYYIVRVSILTIKLLTFYIACPLRKVVPETLQILNTPHNTIPIKLVELIHSTCSVVAAPQYAPIISRFLNSMFNMNVAMALCK